MEVKGGKLPWLAEGGWGSMPLGKLKLKCRNIGRLQLYGNTAQLLLPDCLQAQNASCVRCLMG